VSTAISSQQPPIQSQFDAIEGALSVEGYLILDQLFDTSIIKQLTHHAQNLDVSYFKKAGIGRIDELQQNSAIRSDEICWVNENDLAPKTYLDWTEGLRTHLNRTLFLGLQTFECHFAHYAPGAFYKKHLDAFRGSNCRKVSLILYLNENWCKDDGGELLLYDQGGHTVIETINPTAGRLVVFLSEIFYHEVLPARRDRYSLTGWMRVREPSLLGPE